MQAPRLVQRVRVDEGSVSDGTQTQPPLIAVGETTLSADVRRVGDVVRPTYMVLALTTAE